MRSSSVRYPGHALDGPGSRPPGLLRANATYLVAARSRRPRSGLGFRSSGALAASEQRLQLGAADQAQLEVRRIALRDVLDDVDVELRVSLGLVDLTCFERKGSLCAQPSAERLDLDRSAAALDVGRRAAVSGIASLAARRAAVTPGSSVAVNRRGQWRREPALDGSPDRAPALPRRARAGSGPRDRGQLEHPRPLPRGGVGDHRSLRGSPAAPETADAIAGVRASGLFRIEGEERTEPMPVEQSVGEYLEFLHSTSVLTRAQLGGRAETFDAEVRAVFARHGIERLRYRVVGSVTGPHRRGEPALTQQPRQDDRGSASIRGLVVGNKPPSVLSERQTATDEMDRF
jgi:hypothetical protein